MDSFPACVTLEKDSIPWSSAVHVFPSALSPDELARLDACAFTENRGELSFWLPLSSSSSAEFRVETAAPRCAAEAVLASMITRSLPLLAPYTRPFPSLSSESAVQEEGSLTSSSAIPFAAEECGIEWWVRVQCSRCGGMGLHLDKDEGLWAGAPDSSSSSRNAAPSDATPVSTASTIAPPPPWSVLRHPVWASVLYLTGPTVASTETASSEAGLASTAAATTECSHHSSSRCGLCDGPACAPYRSHTRDAKLLRSKDGKEQEWCGGGPTVVVDKGLVPAQGSHDRNLSESIGDEEGDDDSPPPGWAWVSGNELNPLPSTSTSALCPRSSQPPPLRAVRVWPRAGQWLVFAGDRLHGVGPPDGCACPVAACACPVAACACPVAACACTAHDGSAETDKEDEGGQDACQPIKRPRTATTAYATTSTGTVTPPTASQPAASSPHTASSSLLPPQRRVTVLANLWRSRPRDGTCLRFPLPAQAKAQRLWERYGALSPAEEAAANAECGASCLSKH